MENTYINIMKKKVAEAPYGSTFVVSDFTNDMDYETAKKNIARLEKASILRRVIRGVYDKPKFNTLLNETIDPDMNEVVKAIARSNNWTVCPTGNAALNSIGISTQVPSAFMYLSSGPYKKYNINGIEVSFIHRSDKEMSGFSHKTRLIIQCIKEIGKGKLEYSDKYKIQKSLTNYEMRNMLIEGRQTTSWIFESIKEICGEN